MSEKLGPTGQYPRGKIDPNDDGELNLAIGAVDGKVKIEFGIKVAWLAMYPEQARTMAASLVYMADKAEKETT